MNKRNLIIFITIGAIILTGGLAACKPRVVGLIVFTAVIGMLLATPSFVAPGLLVATALGIGLASASAAAINHVLDSREDAKMARTSNRPLPQGGLRGPCLR